MKFFIEQISMTKNINFINYFKNIFLKPHTPPPLGRWNYHNPDMKANFANLDHCGDKICGSPEILKSYKLSNISDAKSNLDVDSKKVLP